MRDSAAPGHRTGGCAAPGRLVVAAAAAHIAPATLVLHRPYRVRLGSRVCACRNYLIMEQLTQLVLGKSGY